MTRTQVPGGPYQHHPLAAHRAPDPYPDHDPDIQRYRREKERRAGRALPLLNAAKRMFEEQQAFEKASKRGGRPYKITPTKPPPRAA